MSNSTNEILLERAASLITDAGTMWDRILEADIDRNDLEALRYHIDKLEGELALEHDESLLGSNDAF